MDLPLCNKLLLLYSQRLFSFKAILCVAIVSIKKYANKACAQVIQIAYANPFSINYTFIPLALINAKGILHWHLSKSNAMEIEQGIGSEVDHFIYRVPTKNHDLTVQL